MATFSSSSTSSSASGSNDHYQQEQSSTSRIAISSTSSSNDHYQQEQQQSSSNRLAIVTLVTSDSFVVGALTMLHSLFASSSSSSSATSHANSSSNNSNSVSSLYTSRIESVILVTDAVSQHSIDVLNDVQWKESGRVHRVVVVDAIANPHANECSVLGWVNSGYTKVSRTNERVS
jgi:ABC-type anion transport system duplicated permease subunit